MQIKEFIDYYEQQTGFKVKKSTSGWMTRCASHDDGSPSLSISEGSSQNVNVVLNCFGGCTGEDVLLRVGLRLQDLYENDEKKEYKIIDTYPYYREDGTYAYEVVRSNYSKAIPRRKAEDGAWIWSLVEGYHYKIDGAWKKAKTKEQEVGEPVFFPSVDKVLFNLPEIIKRKNEPIFVFGGEKDAKNAIAQGLLATTNQGGEGKWHPSYNKYFVDRIAVVVPDNDEAGEKHVQLVMSNVKPVASAALVIRLEGLPPKGDFSDWIKDHDVEELLNQVYGTDMPNAVMAEKAVLGGILKNPTLIHQAVNENLGQLFFLNNHKLILKAMEACKQIDKITVGTELGNKLIQVGGWDALDELLEKGEPLESLDRYITPIREKHEARELMKIANSVLMQTPNSKDVRGLKDRLSAQLSITRFEDRISVNAQDEARRILENFGEETKGIMTGFHDLDYLTNGLQKTDLIVFAARGKMGKSTLSVNIATNVAKQGLNVIYFSLEMSKKQLVQNIIISEAMVDKNRFKAADLTHEELERIWEAQKKIPSTLIIDDTPAISVQQMEAKIKMEESQLGKFDLIVVDYLQLMQGNKSERRDLEVGGISRDLKAYAKNNDVPVLALAQLNKDFIGRPSAKNIRESDEIQANLDVLGLIHREEKDNPLPENKGLAELIMSGRNIEEGVINLAFLGKLAKFENLYQVDR